MPFIVENGSFTEKQTITAWIKTGSVTDPITAMYIKGLNLYQNRLHHSMKVKTDHLYLEFEALLNIFVTDFKNIKRHPNNISSVSSNIFFCRRL